MEQAITFLDIKQVLASSAPRSRTQLYREIAAGRFPRAQIICGRALWRADAVAEANARYAAEAVANREHHAQRSTARAARMVEARKAA